MDWCRGFFSKRISEAVSFKVDSTPPALCVASGKSEEADVNVGLGCERICGGWG